MTEVPTDDPVEGETGEPEESGENEEQEKYEGGEIPRNGE